jgi:lysophospholipase L1-like esterase
MPLHIVNLGSSFAAGPGISPQVEPSAGRSGANYAHIVAGRLGAKLTDLSVAGATLLNLLHEPQVILRRTFPPQIGEMPEGGADVILMLGGGNDIGYIGGLVEDNFNAYFVLRVIFRVLLWFSGRSGITAPALSADKLAERLGSTLNAIHAKAPEAQVVVVEYLTLLGSDLDPGRDLPFDAGLLENHRARAEQLRVATVKAVQNREPWCVRVPVTEASVGHGLGSREPWVCGFGWRDVVGVRTYHPNALGMIAVADLITQKLQDVGRA